MIGVQDGKLRFVGRFAWAGYCSFMFRKAMMNKICISNDAFYH